MKISRSYCAPAEPSAEFVLRIRQRCLGGEGFDNETNQFVSIYARGIDKYVVGQGQVGGGGEAGPRSYLAVLSIHGAIASLYTRRETTEAIFTTAGSHFLPEGRVCYMS